MRSAASARWAGRHDARRAPVRTSKRRVPTTNGSRPARVHQSDGRPTRGRDIRAGPRTPVRPRGRSSNRSPHETRPRRTTPEAWMRSRSNGCSFIGNHGGTSRRIRHGGLGEAGQLPFNGAVDAQQAADRLVAEDIFHVARVVMQIEQIRGMPVGRIAEVQDLLEQFRLAHRIELTR